MTGLPPSQQMGRGGRFQINPGPLRLVTARSAPVDYNASRCEAITRSGVRCLRDWVYDAEHGRLCVQHQRAAAAKTGERP